MDKSIEMPSDFIETNVLGTFALVECARKYWHLERKWHSEHCRFHHISTDEVYGSLSVNGEPFHESSLYQPSSPYSASKASSDHIVRAYFKTYGLPATISHCSNNYGPYQHVEKLIPKIITSCFQGKPIPIYGDGKNVRDWIHVDDHCEGIGLILKNGSVGETYHLGGNFERSNIEIAEIICNAMDALYPKKTPHFGLIEFVRDRLGHDYRYAINTAKMKESFGWMSSMRFENAIWDTFKFYESVLSYFLNRMLSDEDSLLKLIYCALVIGIIAKVVATQYIIIRIT